MFNISYTTWEQTCEMYFNIKKGSKKSYLQWFPFSKLNSDEEKYISSKEFFKKYIENFSFVMFSKAISRTENFMIKGDGSFRDASLISPLLYLLIQAIGKEVEKKYNSKRDPSIDVFYAGNYITMDPTYKKSYDSFYKILNGYSDEYEYFIKTDITNFFSNINVDKLINFIDKQTNGKNKFTPIQLTMIKELLLYCGEGKFPIIENSISNSYLATIVYLEEIDNKLFNFINKNIEGITSFRLIRYVDDLYILFNTELDKKNRIHIYNQIKNVYSSILKEYGLFLNSKKCCLEKTIDINNELKKSLYDEIFNDIEYNIEDSFEGEFQEFINDILLEQEQNTLDIDKYNEFIDKYFTKDDIVYTSTEVYNYFVYQNNYVLQEKEIIQKISKIINIDTTFIALDPRRLTTMIVKSGDEEIIKLLVDKLCNRNDNNLWNAYDNSIAIFCLLLTGFKYTNLLDILKSNVVGLYNYYEYFCQNSFIHILETEKENRLVEIINNDKKTYILYFMHLVESNRYNILVEFAFYKNYFDRMTANIDYFFKINNEKKPNYNKFYRESELKKFYANIFSAEESIKNAQNLRNQNPLNHASAELLNKSSTTKDLKKSIKNLSCIIDTYINNNLEK